MATILDAIRKINQFVNETRSSMQTITTDVAGDFLAAKIEQIRKVGIGSYSKSRYSAHFLRGKELNASGRSFIERKIKSKEKTNWAELRASQGLQISYVDVYYSGQMINSLGLIRTNTASSRYYVVIGARNEEARKKLEANRKRYGDFLKPSTGQQVSMIGTKAIRLIGDIYKRILLT